MKRNVAEKASERKRRSRFVGMKSAAQAEHLQQLFLNIYRILFV